MMLHLYHLPFYFYDLSQMTGSHTCRRPRGGQNGTNLGELRATSVRLSSQGDLLVDGGWCIWDHYHGTNEATTTHD